MNIGIVIGVSDYQNVASLPGCVNDARAMNQLLEMVGKCDDILYLTEPDSTSSKSLKAKLTTFVNKYSSEKIEEVVFYFTGHGLFEEDQFYYVLTDYETSKKNQTCLGNDELDNLLRNLSADLTIKIVDACQSGTRYVKDPDSFQKYLHKSEKQFNKCYFYYSSQNDQYSYQNKEISDFTLSFLSAFADRDGQEIRYKDILDSLADSFSSNSSQTPFFVMQGSYTEVFGFISKEISEAIRELITSEIPPELERPEEQRSLIQLIEDQAAVYCDQERAMESLELLREFVNGYEFDQQIKQIYECKIEFQSDPGVQINTDYLGRFLSKSETNYFVRIEKETRTREVPKSRAFASLMATTTMLGDEVPMRTESYSAISGASSTVELPFEHIFIRLESKYPNVNDTGCLIFPFLSQTKMAILACFFRYRSREWDVKQIVRSTCEWSGFEEYIKDASAIEVTARTIMGNYANYTFKPVLEEFGLEDGEG